MAEATSRRGQARRKRKAKKEPPKSKAQRIHEMPDAFVECRDMGHTWRIMASKDDRRAWGTVYRERRCRVCGTWRYEHIGARSVEIVQSRYKYPKGYLQKGVGQNINRREVRVEAITRLLKEVRNAKRAA